MLPREQCGERAVDHLGPLEEQLAEFLADAPESVTRFVRTGASPRGAQALLLAAKIRALIEGRFAASIDDVKASVLPALRHRVLLNFEGEAEGVKTDGVLTEILAKLPESKA